MATKHRCGHYDDLPACAGYYGYCCRVSTRIDWLRISHTDVLLQYRHSATRHHFTSEWHWYRHPHQAHRPPSTSSQQPTRLTHIRHPSQHPLSRLLLHLLPNPLLHHNCDQMHNHHPPLPNPHKHDLHPRHRLRNGAIHHQCHIHYHSERQFDLANPLTRSKLPRRHLRQLQRLRWRRHMQLLLFGRRAGVLCPRYRMSGYQDL